MHRIDSFDEKPIDMKDFDPMAQVNTLKKVQETIKDERRRKILDNAINHAIAEASGNYEALMASCSRKRQSYMFWGATPGSLQHPVKSSYEELEKFYGGIIASGAWRIHFDVDKVVVGDDEIVMDGVMHQLYPTEILNAMMPFKVDSSHRAYQMTKRMAVTFMFDEDGISCGEHSYTNGPVVPGDFTPIPDSYALKIFNAA